MQLAKFSSLSTIQSVELTADVFTCIWYVRFHCVSHVWENVFYCELLKTKWVPKLYSIFNLSERASNLHLPGIL